MTKGDDSRKYKYIAAREHYAKKNNDNAQELFKTLYLSKELDKWSVQSLNLDLDILNQPKSIQKS